jgi:hypothetical protein
METGERLFRHSCGDCPRWGYGVQDLDELCLMVVMVADVDKISSMVVLFVFESESCASVIRPSLLVDVHTFFHVRQLGWWIATVMSLPVQLGEIVVTYT